MGLCFAEPIAAGVTIREFARRDEENADGWGLAWYPDRSLAVVKEPLRWQESHFTSFLESYRHLRSSIYLAHVRRKTVGGPPTHADTHPFQRELGGREYCFAHNGTLEQFAERLPLGRFRPVGVTDSEYYFCHLLEALARRGGNLAGEADWRWLHGQLAEANRLGKLNVLLSEGRRLYCYHDAGGYKGLVLRPVHVKSHEPRTFADHEVRVDLGADTANRGFVVATHPLSGSNWRPFQPGELVVLDAGAVAFSSHAGAKGHPT